MTIILKIQILTFPVFFSYCCGVFLLFILSEELIRASFLWGKKTNSFNLISFAEAAQVQSLNVCMRLKIRSNLAENPSLTKELWLNFRQTKHTQILCNQHARCTCTLHVLFLKCICFFTCSFRYITYFFVFNNTRFYHEQIKVTKTLLAKTIYIYLKRGPRPILFVVLPEKYENVTFFKNKFRLCSRQQFHLR